jgi:putative hydrolase of the HAD superfamily
LRAVLFDAGNTLVFLDYHRMARAVATALDMPLSGDRLAAGASEASCAMEAARGTDRERAAAYLETLFQVAGVPPERMGTVRDCLTRLHQELHLWCSVADDTHSALARLRAAGLRLGVVSNSDGRVEVALEAAGLLQYFDVVLDSAVVGVEKPDPAIFRAALDALGVRPEEALFVGDLYEVDVVGARAAGMTAVLLRTDRGGPDARCRIIDSLSLLADDLLQGDGTAS